MVTRFLVMWAVNVAALFVVAAVLDDISFDDWWTVFVAGLVFGVVNSLVRPVVRAFMKTAGKPLVWLTFGIALFLVNVLMLYLTHWIVAGFRIDSFGAAVVGAIIIWVVQAILEAVFGIEKKRAKKT